MAILTHDGYTSYRNKDKAYKRPRTVEKADGEVEYHPLDMMKVPGSDNRVNSTGCFGTIKSTGTRRLTVLKPTGSTRPNRARRRKASGKLYYGNTALEYETKSIQNLIALRRLLHTVICIEDHTNRNMLSHRYRAVYDRINHLIKTIYPKKYQDMIEQDNQRKRSIKGSAKKQRFVKPKGLRAKIIRAENFLESLA